MEASMSLLWIPGAVGILSIATAAYLFSNLRRAKPRSERMAEIGSAISIGVKAYLSRQLRTILLITPVLALVLWRTLSFPIALTFILGVLTSLITAFVGMNAAIRANVKTAGDALYSSERAFRTAVVGGSIMGFSITGFSLVVL
jgi:K(+)-stimulated pyrophosphate-energized sodium pump